MKALTYIYISILLVLIHSCQNKTAVVVEDTHQNPAIAVVELTDAQYKEVNIQLGKIEMKDLQATIEVNGMLDVPPQNLVSVSAMMGGFIKTTNLLQGKKVRKGQVLLTLQNPVFIGIQTLYLENIQKLKFLELEYKRQEELSNENVASKKIFQQISSDYHSLQASVRGQEEELKILKINPKNLTQASITSVVSIYAPINGYVTTVNINIGKYVTPQDIICEIVNTEHLHAELTVFEKDIPKIKIGQKIGFYLVNESGLERRAHVYLINHQISPERTVRVHAHIDVEDPSLMPSMYLKAFIEVGENNKKTVVPEKAIVEAAGKYYIFITDSIQQSKEQHSYKAIEIIKGLSHNGYTQIDLPKDMNVQTTTVVIEGAYDLLSKMSISQEEDH
jgi:cobalt-zinc-cadmium efflux system membrane fusion protein